MGKRRKGQGPQQQDFSGTDKPEYARDWFHEEKPKKQEAAKKSDENEQASVQDYLGQSALSALAKLKAQMVEAAAKAEAAKAVTSAGAQAEHRGKTNRPDAATVAKNREKFASASQGEEAEEREASFAELFDPAEPDDASFADLLKKSKLDWRAFKD